MTEHLTDLIIDARKADIGGLEVARLLPFRARRMVGPFIYLEHAGPLALPSPVPRSQDVRPHPHIGLATVSYPLSGELMHRDSTGAQQLIRPGDVNWMTAGRGISHSERFDGAFREAGGRFELLQAWVALPEAAEETESGFVHLGRAELPVIEESGCWARLIAGTAYGITSGVPTHSPLFYLHVELQPGAQMPMPADHSERAAYVVNGQIEVDGHAYRMGQMVVFAPGGIPTITATEPSTLMLLGGEGIGPRHIWWNFVSSSKERIEQAKADWQAGRIALPVDDDQEFIPLPEGK